MKVTIEIDVPDGYDPYRYVDDAIKSGVSYGVRAVTKPEPEAPYLIKEQINIID